MECSWYVVVSDPWSLALNFSWRKGLGLDRWGGWRYFGHSSVLPYGLDKILQNLVSYRVEDTLCYLLCSYLLAGDTRALLTIGNGSWIELGWGKLRRWLCRGIGLCGRLLDLEFTDPGEIRKRRSSLEIGHGCFDWRLSGDTLWGSGD